LHNVSALHRLSKLEVVVHLSKAAAAARLLHMGELREDQPPLHRPPLGHAVAPPNVHLARGVGQRVKLARVEQTWVGDRLVGPVDQREALVPRWTQR